MHRTFLLFIIILSLALLPGCGGVRPVAGGTKGVLRAGGEKLGDIQVTIHRLDGATWRPLGFGVTAMDGAFRLVTNGAKGPLWLSPGEYRCTLESAGAPVTIPSELALPESTPLRISWSQSDEALNLDAPKLLIR